jgi:hypothetical protein
MNIRSGVSRSRSMHFCIVLEKKSAGMDIVGTIPLVDWNKVLVDCRDHVWLVKLMRKKNKIY